MTYSKNIMTYLQEYDIFQEYNDIDYMSNVKTQSRLVNYWSHDLW